MRRVLLALAIAGAALAAPASANTGCEQQNQRVEDLCYATVAPIARYLCDNYRICLR